jgi:outer membrane protein
MKMKTMRSLMFVGASLLAASVAAAQTAPQAPQATQEAPTVRPPAPPQAVAAAPNETLRDAMVKAYQTNPTLLGAQADLRATDLNVPIARSSGLPNLGATGSLTHSLYDNGSTGFGPTSQGTVGTSLSVPVYSGGAVKNSIKAADARVDAGRSTLRSNEQQLFTDVVTAYLNVVRDEAIVRLNQENVHVLEVNLQATRDRFEVGDLTRTDVAQSEARLALAQSQLRTAEAQLIGSRESYIRVVGTPPGSLATPPQLPNLPADVATAVTTALAENPTLEGAQRSRVASKYDVSVARAGALPKLSLTGSTSYYNYLGTVGNPLLYGPNSGFSVNGGVSMSLPLFQGGRPTAQVRQAQERETEAIENVTGTERTVVAATRAAYAVWTSSTRVIESSRIAVQANQLSLEGVRAENSVGSRTILDILNAEQELLNSQVQYVTAQRDAYVAGFALLAAMGKAEAQDLGLDAGPLYDPVTHYKRVRNDMWDWGSDPEPVGKATRTVDTPAQTPAVSGSLDPLLQQPVDTPMGNPPVVKK